MVRVELQCALVGAHVRGTVTVNTLMEVINVCNSLAVMNIMARGQYIHIYKHVEEEGKDTERRASVVSFLPVLVTEEFY